MSQTAQLIKPVQRHANDTGSPESQVAILTSRITQTSAHCEANPNDNHSRRGLIGMVNRRNKLLKYLKASSQERYEALIKKLGLRK
ncbi:MAG: 30S ribosomal protein S15 [Alphaproteobacteria bacterium]|nr:MAG: 30S ribosomal protein S15 [Alphaproteobacteria bacterium]